MVSKKRWTVLLIAIIWGVLGNSVALLDSNDSLITVGDGTLRRIRVPILMYHYVSLLPANADDIRIGLTVEPPMFQEHARYLHEAGYTTISLYQLYNALMYGEELPLKPVVLTFDDGHSDHYVNVFPVLKSYNMTGTFFIITQFADENRRGYMSWSEINEMAQYGMSIEAHTKRHMDLRNRDYDFLVYEILGSVESVIAHTGVSAGILSYPAGRYDQKTLDAVETMPILHAVTTQYGATHVSTRPLELSRLRISGGTGVNGLAYLLETAP